MIIAKAGGVGGGAPIDATFITQTPSATLTNEQALSALATGILLSTTGTGVVSIAAQGVDYYAPGGTDVAIADGGTGQSTAQLAINALTNVAAATNEHVLTKDTGTGNAIWKVSAGGSSLPVVDETAIVYETGVPANTLTFDVTPFTAARVWTWPDATTTVAGLGVANVFTVGQTITGSADQNQLSVTGFTTQTLSPVVFTGATATNNAVQNVLRLGQNVSGGGVGAFGLGAGVKFTLHSSTTPNRDAAQIAAVWPDAAGATDATRSADIVFSTVNGAAALAEVVRITKSPGVPNLTIGAPASIPAGWQLYVEGQSGGMYFKSTNASAFGIVRVDNSAGKIAQIVNYGASIAGTILGVTRANTCVFYSNNTNGMIIGTTPAAPIYFSTTDTLRLTITSGGDLQFADAKNIIFDTTTGTKIGTATTQKIAFWNATPVVQPAAVADATGAGDVVAQLNALLARIRSLGLIAT